MILAIDFDGTLVKHRYPDIGEPVPGAFESLKRFKELGMKLILWTMRDNGKDGPMLDQAVEFCRKQGVEFDYVNENPEQKSWTSSPKAYAHFYIDDAAIGCPLMIESYNERPYVDWRFIVPRVLSLLDDEIIARRIRERENKKIAEQARQKEGEGQRMEENGNGEPEETRTP